jgi:hypothetical protein
MNFSAQDLMEKIIELRIQLDYQIVETPLAQTEDNIQYNAKQMIYTFELLKFNYPTEFAQFLEFNPKYKALDVISKDNSEGLEQILSCIDEDKEKTVASIVKKVQTHQFHQWVKKNITKETAEKCETEADQAVYIHMAQFNLPQVKQEEIGDCIALAFTGILSEHANKFNNPNLHEENKQGLLRQLMTDNRKYVNWDFNSLTVEDQTEQYAQRKTLYRPRNVAASKMIDSTYTDGKHLFAVISTNNSDTSSQRSQAFEIYKTLQANFENKSLNLDQHKDLTPSVILFNNSFFCTENPDKIVHKVGTSEIEKTGYHHNNLRTKFDALFDKPLSKSKLDKINGLVTLSMLGNKEINWPRFPHTFDICDIIYCNPITAGSDTLWLHTKFEQLKIYQNPQRTQKMFNFLLDYSNDVIDSLLLIEPNATEAIVDTIKDSYARLIHGVVKNFNSYNLHRELNEDEIKKLEALEQKIEAFNIKQPNKTIDPVLTALLNSHSFERLGKKTIERIEKSTEQFEKNIAKEKENKENIQQQIQAAILSNSEKIDPNVDNVFTKIDAVAYQVYKHKSGGKVVKISDFLNIIDKNMQLADIHQCSYLNIPLEASPNYNYIKNFISPSGTTRKNFLNKLDEVASTNITLFTAYENIDSYITSFLKQFQTDEGRKTILSNGGTVSVLEKLLSTIEKDIDVINQNSVKKYEEYKEVTPFNDIEHSHLSAYWKNQVKVSSGNDNYDHLVALAHEYLHRIEDKFNANEIVSGNSFTGLSNKIQTIKKLGGHYEHVLEEVNVLIARYNILGSKYDEQNKNKKKYKPKSYRMQ